MASGSTLINSTLIREPGNGQPPNKLAAPLILALLLLGLYHLALFPSFPAFGDGAKLQLVGSTWGTPHHSGYPLWTVLANLLHRVVPFATAAYHANLLSALCSVVGSLFFFATAQLLGLRRGPAFALALAFGGSPTLWSQSIEAEVYTLHYAFMAAVLFFLIRWGARRRELDLCFAVALYVFSFSNHLTAICLAPAVLGYVWVTDRTRLLSPKVLAAGLVGGVATLLAYQYIVVRTLTPTTVYLESQGASLLEVLGHLASEPKRSHYFTKDLLALVTERLPLVLGTLGRELHLLLLLAAVGAVKAPGRINLLLGLAALGNLAFVTSFTVPDSYVYFIPLYLVIALWAAMGLERLMRRVPAAAYRVAVAALAVLAIAFVAPRVVQIPATHTRLVQLDATLESTLDRLPRTGALLLSTDYESSMGLLARAAFGHPAESNVHVIHTPPATLGLEVVFQPLQRYLQQDLPLRRREYSGWIEAGLPAYCLCRRPEHAAAFETLGFSARPLGLDLYRLETAVDAPKPLPRLVIVHALEGADDLAEAITRLRSSSFDPTRTAVHLGAPSQGQPGRKIISTILEQHHRSRRVEALVELAEPGWLEWTEAASESWQVQVDGEDRSILELNALFPAVALETGRHRVSFFQITR